ncbi:hypothetical protein DMI70_22990 [Escherichia coli]|nr:hypothetical protein [Escherichia coli]
MGHPEKAVSLHRVSQSFMCGTVCLPAISLRQNLVELEILCEHPVNNVEEAVLAARELIAQGPQIVLVKHGAEMATAVTVLKCTASHRR